MRVPVIITLITAALAAFSCKKEKNNTVLPDQENPVSVYPIPPSRWMMHNNTPYYSSGFVGDVMPFFDNGKFHLYYLHDARDGQPGFHPIHKFVSDDFVHYEYDGLMVPYAGQQDQDLAIGTGSVVKVGSTYYCYYTGHNYLFPASGRPKEGIMYATSTDMKTWTKKTGFNMLAPVGYEVHDFRDPQVFFNTEKNEYWMLISARKNGKAVVALFATNDPAADQWELRNPLFTTDDDSYFMLECADVFKWGSKWYLLFSENNKEKVTHYRVATSSEGPWEKPAKDQLDGEYFYAAKTASDGNNRFAFGWAATKESSNDAGNKMWAGNLIVHQLKQAPDGTLSVQAPAGVSALFNTVKKLEVSAQKGTVNTSENTFSLQPSSQVLFGRISGQKMISFALSGMETDEEAGILLGAGSGSADHYKVRFSMADKNVSLVRVSGSDTFTETSVPFAMEPGKEYTVRIVIDNSICVVYVNDAVALSGRIYSLSNQSWGLYTGSTPASFKQLQLMEQ
ncbi:MAG: glycoside hydrolase domain-containing protein [Chitinophagaceae bacterium]